MLRPNWILVPTVFAVLLAVAQSSFSADKRASRQGAKAAATATSAAQSPSASGGVHPLTQQVLKAGGLNCVARVEQMTRFLGRGRNVAMLQQPSHSGADGLMMASILGETAPDKQYVAVMSFAPTRQGVCEGNYQHISYRSASCSEVVSKEFKQHAGHQVIGKSISMIVLTKTARVFAMAAGSGCVLIRQELVDQ